jgi:superfamily II DNA/RNA helicase
VVNYQCPEDSKTYVHRIGRTGRAGKEGVAVTLVDWDEMPRWKMVSDDLGLGIEEPAETYSTSDHLYAELEIPSTATGRLPRSKRTRAGLDAEYVDPELDHGGRKRGDRVSGRDRKRGDDRVEDAVLAPRGPRRPRERTRSRSGVSATGAPEGGSVGTAAETADTGSSAVVTQAQPQAQPQTQSQGPEGDATATNGSGPRPDGTRPRRRRRRGGRGRAGGQGAGQADTEQASAGSDAAAS